MKKVKIGPPAGGQLNGRDIENLNPEAMRTVTQHLSLPGDSTFSTKQSHLRRPLAYAEKADRFLKVACRIAARAAIRRSTRAPAEAPRAAVEDSTARCEEQAFSWSLQAHGARLRRPAV